MRLMLYSGAVSSRIGPPPPWLGILQMSDEWGTPPWVIEAAKGSLKWAARWAAYRAAVRWVRENE